MSILIKGMEMPTRCYTCPCADLEFLDCNLMPGTRIEQHKRLDDCPLVPVPPHGRLGDFDEFAKVVLNWITTQEKAYPNEDSNALSWRLGARAMGHQIYRDIEAAPTIIPAEDSRLSATIKCGGAVTCAVAHSEEVYNKHVDTAGNLRWTGTHSGEHIIPTEEGE